MKRVSFEVVLPRLPFPVYTPGKCLSMPLLASHPPVTPFLWRTACSYLQPMWFSQAGTMAWHVCNPDLVVKQILPEIDEGSEHQTVRIAQNFCESSRERGPLFLVVLLRHLGSGANVAAWHPCGTLESFPSEENVAKG